MFYLSVKEIKLLIGATREPTVVSILLAQTDASPKCTFCHNLPIHVVGKNMPRHIDLTHFEFGHILKS